MKQLLLSLGIFTLLFMTPSCDVIDQPFKGNVQDTTSTQQQRNVLIEDFTGHRCKNCPKASKAIEALVDAYGSRIIGLAIHAGPGNFTNTIQITLLTLLRPKEKPSRIFLEPTSFLWGW